MIILLPVITGLHVSELTVSTTSILAVQSTLSVINKPTRHENPGLGICRLQAGESPERDSWSKRGTSARI